MCGQAFIIEIVAADVYTGKGCFFSYGCYSKIMVGQ